MKTRKICGLIWTNFLVRQHFSLDSSSRALLPGACAISISIVPFRSDDQCWLSSGNGQIMQRQPGNLNQSPKWPRHCFDEVLLSKTKIKSENERAKMQIEKCQNSHQMNPDGPPSTESAWTEWRNSKLVMENREWRPLTRANICVWSSANERSFTRYEMANIPYWGHLPDSITSNAPPFISGMHLSINKLIAHSVSDGTCGLDQI